MNGGECDCKNYLKLLIELCVILLFPVEIQIMQPMKRASPQLAEALSNLTYLKKVSVCYV